MNNSFYGKATKKKISFEMEKYFLKLMYNSSYGKTIKKNDCQLSFYNVPIQKPYVKRFNNKDLLHELPFFNEFNIVKTSRAF